MKFKGRPKNSFSLKDTNKTGQLNMTCGSELKTLLGSMPEHGWSWGLWVTSQDKYSDLDSWGVAVTQENVITGLKYWGVMGYQVGYLLLSGSGKKFCTVL